jgi:acetyltransferase-like isoleucine patch superfamily enzyme
MIISKIIERLRFYKYQDRMGPDMLFTHWKLYFKSTMLPLCKSKFKFFDETAEFRPGAYAIYCSKISIGQRVVIRPNTMLFADEFASIIIEDDVLIGSGVHMYTHNHRYDNPKIPIIDQGYYSSKNVTVKCGAWIGANAILLPGVVVGENSVIGAGSIVTKNVPPKTVVAGNPAKIIKKIN